MGRAIYTSLLSLIFLLAALSAPAARAYNGGGILLAAGAGPTWQQLTPRERRLLRRERKSWSGYSPNQRRHMINGMQQYLRMSPTQRERLRQRAQRFNQMSPTQKRRLCARYYQERGTLPALCQQLK